MADKQASIDWVFTCDGRTYEHKRVAPDQRLFSAAPLPCDSLILFRKRSRVVAPETQLNVGRTGDDFLVVFPEEMSTGAGSAKRGTVLSVADRGHDLVSADTTFGELSPDGEPICMALLPRTFRLFLLMDCYALYDVDPAGTVEQFKRQMQEDVLLEPWDIRLIIFGNQTRSNDDLLGSYGIYPDCFLHAAINMRSGPNSYTYQPMPAERRTAERPPEPPWPRFSSTVLRVTGTRGPMQTIEVREGGTIAARDVVARYLGE